MRSNLGTMAYYAGRWTEAAAVVPLQPRRRDGGGQRLRRGPDRRQPRRAADQPGPPRRGGGGARRAPCGSCGPRVPCSSSPRARCSWRACTSAAATWPRPSGGPPRSCRPSRRSTTTPAPWRPRWCRPRRCCASQRPAEALAIIDGAERDAGARRRVLHAAACACSGPGPCSPSTGSTRPPSRSSRGARGRPRAGAALRGGAAAAGRQRRSTRVAGSATDAAYAHGAAPRSSSPGWVRWASARRGGHPAVTTASSRRRRRRPCR